MAHTKPLGTTCKLHYDSPREVEAFDVIRTEPAGTCYRVLEVRIQERGKHAGKKHLKCVRIAAGDVEEDDVVRPLYWYQRSSNRKRRA